MHAFIMKKTQIFRILVLDQWIALIARRVELVGKQTVGVLNACLDIAVHYLDITGHTTHLNTSLHEEQRRMVLRLFKKKPILP